MSCCGAFLVDKGTLNQYRYLEHGAFWAIAALAVIMFLQTLMEIPEVVTGLIGASDHVFDVVSVTRAVDVSVMSFFGFVFHVGDGNRHNFAVVTNGSAFRDIGIGFRLGFSLAGLDVNQSRCQSRFSMVNVTDGSNVHVRFCALEFGFRHL
jgi:hypothetical protein